MKRDYKKRFKKYTFAFKKALKTRKPIIFLTHNAPYNTKLDKLKVGSQKGEHYGSYLDKLMIKNYI